MTTTTTQGQRQESVRAVTGTELDYNGDWSALFDLHSINANKDWNGRFIDWVNAKLGLTGPDTITNMPHAQAALAIDNGSTHWDALGTFDASAPA